MAQARFSGMIDDKGNFSPDSRIDWTEGKAKFRGKRVSITIETAKRRKTNDQSAYLHAIVIPFFQDRWNQERRIPYGLPPYSKDQVRGTLADACFGTVEGPLPGTHERTEGQGTAELSTAQYARLTEFCLELAWDMYKSRLPKPGEYSHEEVA